MTVETGPVRRRFGGGFRLKLFAYALVAPVVLLILGLVAYPFLFAIWVSFTDMVVGSTGQFVGFKNFEYLAGTSTFWSAIWNTITIVLVSDVLKLVIGLGLALLVHQNLPGRGIFRSFLMLPWAMPAFVAFLTWRVLYQPIGGGINLILTQTGLYPEVIDFLGTRQTAMASVIIASVWRGFPFWFISILAALQSVPKELYEAAIVDGANTWQRFWNVTIPSILPVIIVTTLLSSIWTANGFEHVWLLTAGGPSDATMVFPVLAYFGMQTQRIGEAAAVSVYMLPVLSILVLFATSLMMRREE
ncbi:sugar ABC transporter permease [Devosia sp. ZB163]|uniref:carbohydrate ABC transporter permease n=1 Tax=Devosia sp. ZB163 TaxID=3025938 RepID=UPI0023631819|nr:sugar ABC transporter permease [Devosia sp. ZB163]MDC9822714.1 sugar ABC transporter permease [Devosia sp. ZB163]